MSKHRIDVALENDEFDRRVYTLTGLPELEPDTRDYINPSDVVREGFIIGLFAHLYRAASIPTGDVVGVCADSGTSEVEDELCLEALRREFHRTADGRSIAKLANAFFSTPSPVVWQARSQRNFEMYVRSYYKGALTAYHVYGVPAEDEKGDGPYIAITQGGYLKRLVYIEKQMIDNPTCPFMYDQLRKEPYVARIMREAQSFGGYSVWLGEVRGSIFYAYEG